MFSLAILHIGRTRGPLVYAPEACLAFSVRPPIFVFRHVTAIVYRPRVLLSTMYLVDSGVLITGASTANKYTSGIDRSIRTTTYKFSLFSFASCCPYFLGFFPSAEDDVACSWFVGCFLDGKNERQREGARESRSVTGELLAPTTVNGLLSAMREITRRYGATEEVVWEGGALLFALAFPYSRLPSPFLSSASRTLQRPHQLRRPHPLVLASL